MPFSGRIEANELICLGVPATPVLDWDPVPEAAYYMIYLANDRELTNRVFGNSAAIPITTNTRWTLTSGMPKEALADNQAGQSYYWFVRPCKAAASAVPTRSRRTRPRPTGSARSRLLLS